MSLTDNFKRGCRNVLRQPLLPGTLTKVPNWDQRVDDPLRGGLEGRSHSKVFSLTISIQHSKFLSNPSKAYQILD